MWFNSVDLVRWCVATSALVINTEIAGGKRELWSCPATSAKGYFFF